MSGSSLPFRPVSCLNVANISILIRTGHGGEDKDLDGGEVIFPVDFRTAGRFADVMLHKL